MKLNTFKDTTHIKIRRFSHLAIADFFYNCKIEKKQFLQNIFTKNLNNLHYFDTFKFFIQEISTIYINKNIITNKQTNTFDL